MNNGPPQDPDSSLKLYLICYGMIRNVIIEMKSEFQHTFLSCYSCCLINCIPKMKVFKNPSLFQCSFTMYIEHKSMVKPALKAKRCSSWSIHLMRSKRYFRDMVKEK